MPLPRCRLLIFVMAVAAYLSPFSFGVLAAGADEPSGALESDRPDFTEGTCTIKPGRVQLESGYTYTREGSAKESHVFPELLLRAGFGLNTNAKDLFTRGGFAWKI